MKGVILNLETLEDITMQHCLVPECGFHQYAANWGCGSITRACTSLVPNHDGTITSACNLENVAQIINETSRAEAQSARLQT